ncbi:MAG: Flp pilus assembly protein CpaB [Verrucomicrobia bacterium]|nr:Flp pilus assembly protein CpaB [Verrucomicrobiota bacterium]
MKQKIILIAALLAGIAAFILSKQNFENFKVKFLKQFAQVRVVAAARNIPVGTVLTMGDIGAMMVFAKNVTGRAVLPDEYTELVGKKTRVFIEKEQPILWSDVDMPYGGVGGMSGMIKLGERAVAIPVDNTSSVSGHVKPNDHVDIIGTFTFPGATKGGAAAGGQQLPDTVTLTILQDVTVLATGQVMSRRATETQGGADRFGSQYSSVTVGVTPREAEMLVFAHQKGRLALSLRNREDVSVEQQLENVDFQKLEKNFNELNRVRQQRLHPQLLSPSSPVPATAVPRTTPLPTLGR